MKYRAVVAASLLFVRGAAWAAPSSNDALDAEAARAAGLFERCIEKDEAALATDDDATTRVHLAGCAERAGRILLALEHLRVVLERAIAERNADVADLARLRAEQLLARAGTVVVEAPALEGTRDVEVRFDDERLDPSRLARPITVDPGPHRVRAVGTKDGVPAVFERIVDVAPGGRITVAVVLEPRPAEFLTPGQIACMQLARNQDEVFHCLPGKSKPLVVRAALEASGYGDTLSVFVVNPAVRASVTSPTHGWNAAASYQVDVVSAASPDIVSTASPRGHDTRHALSLSGGYKPKSIGVDASAAFSTESDYVARSAGGGVRAELAEKRVVPRIGFSTSYDTIGRGGTSFDVFRHDVTSNEIAASAAIVVSAKTTLTVGATASFERGDQSKPYRLIPMFGAGASVPAGASADRVNRERLSVRPYEQLPLERDRWAASGRLITRLNRSTTVRLEERLYTDSWLNHASSTDVRYLFDASSRATIGPHGRFHLQRGANFYHRVYHAETSPQLVVPTYRTSDRELGPLHQFTGGVLGYFRLSGDDAALRTTLYASADALLTRYRDALYVTSRFGAYGTLGIEGEFE